MVTSDLLKIAFGISELLSRKYPAVSFHVLKGLWVEGAEEAPSVGIISNRCHIIITDDRIYLSATGDDHSFCLTEYDAFVDVGLPRGVNKHVFELPDPNAIDKLLSCVDENLNPT